MPDKDYFEEENIEYVEEEKSGAGKIVLTALITMLLTLAACAGAYYWFIYRKQQEEKKPEEEIIVVVEDENVMMPELRGFKASEAIDILSNLGLDYFSEDVVYDYSDSIAEGLITATEPMAGSTVNKKTKLVLKASKGQKEKEPEPEPEPAVNKTEDIIIEVQGNSLRIRDYPSTETGTQVGKLSKHTVITAHETYRNEGYTWYRISDNEWVADDGTWVKELAKKPSNGSFTIRTLDYNIKIRSTPKVEEGNQVGKITKNTILTAYETTTTEDGYMWYRIGDNQWIADNGTWISVIK